MTTKPWETEPNYEEFWHNGVMCAVIRGPSSALCGYVSVSEGHPLFGADYGIPDVDVHGGLTYAEKTLPTADREATADFDPVWWFGFDCAHAWDFVPRMDDPDTDFNRRHPEFRTLALNKTYRDFAYVKAETMRLADQLVEARNEQ